MLSEEIIIEKLDQLSKIRITYKSSSEEMAGIISQALRSCPDLKQQYEELQMELGALSQRETEITNEIKEEILKRKKSIKGNHLQAVFTYGRVTWDTKALEGYAIAHPKINTLKKVGEPSVSIKEVKESEEK